MINGNPVVEHTVWSCATAAARPSSRLVPRTEEYWARNRVWSWRGARSCLGRLTSLDDTYATWDERERYGRDRSTSSNCGTYDRIVCGGSRLGWSGTHKSGTIYLFFKKSKNIAFKTYQMGTNLQKLDCCGKSQAEQLCRRTEDDSSSSRKVMKNAMIPQIYFIASLITFLKHHKSFSILRQCCSAIIFFLLNFLHEYWF